MEKGQRELTSVDLRVQTADAQDPIGIIGQTSDNRLFRYAQIGATNVGAGLCVVSPTFSTAYMNLSVTQAVAAGVNSNTILIRNGSTAITSTSYFNGGDLTVVSGTGAGSIYKIKGNSLAAANGVITLIVGDPIVNALDTTSVVDLTISPWTGLTTSITSGSNADNPRVVGVTTIPMTANYYGWIQCEGLCGLQNDGSNNSGQGAGVMYQGLSLVLSKTTAGQVTVANATADADKQVIGMSYIPNSANGSSKFFPAYLQIF